MGERRLARIATAIACAALALAGLYAGSNPDTFGHLAQGRQILELGRVPSHDTWSLLSGAPRAWHNYEWLSDLLAYLLLRSFGYDGLIFAKCLLLGLTGWLLMGLARRWGGDRATSIAALLLIAAIPALRFRLSDRPHLLGLALAASYLALLARVVDGELSAQGRRRVVAALFVLHVSWVNLHGSHLLGVAITVAFALFAPASARRTCGALLGLEALASCISPYGPLIVSDAIAHVLDPRYRALVSEWSGWQEQLPPWLQLGPTLHALLLTLVAPRLARLGPGPRAALAIGAVLAVGSFRSIRFVADFLLLTLPLLGAGYASLLGALSPHRFAAGWLVGLLFLSAAVPLGAAELPPHRGIGHGIAPGSLPEGPGRLLRRAALAPRVFANIQHSWALMWEAPNARFFIDGRVPFYGPDHVARARLALQSPALLDAILREDEINAVVLMHGMHAERLLAQALEARSGWSLNLVDDAYALYTRDDLTRASGYPRLELLRPTLQPDWVLSLPADAGPLLSRELSALAAFPSARSYRPWVRALWTLAPLRRGRVQDGFRWPIDEQDRARYREARALLAEAAIGLADVQAVSTLRAIVEATLCNLDAASAALARASEDGVAREVMFAAQEIALRRGQVDQVAAIVRAARARPEGRSDPWLMQLERGLREPPPCPPSAAAAPETR
jgi:hypothetical protein